MKMALAHEKLIYSSEPPFENIKVIKTKKDAALTLRYSIGNETTVRVLVGSKRQENY